MTSSSGCDWRPTLRRWPSWLGPGRGAGGFTPAPPISAPGCGLLFPSRRRGWRVLAQVANQAHDVVGDEPPDGTSACFSTSAAVVAVARPPTERRPPGRPARRRGRGSRPRTSVASPAPRPSSSTAAATTAAMTSPHSPAPSWPPKPPPPYPLITPGEARPPPPFTAKRYR
jgi:hypothetical protein